VLFRGHDGHARKGELHAPSRTASLALAGLVFPSTSSARMNEPSNLLEAETGSVTRACRYGLRLHYPHNISLASGGRRGREERRDQEPWPALDRENEPPRGARPRTEDARASMKRGSAPHKAKKLRLASHAHARAPRLPPPPPAPRLPTHSRSPSPREIGRRATRRAAINPQFNAPPCLEFAAAARAAAALLELAI